MDATQDKLRALLTAEQLPAMPHSALSVLQLSNDPSIVKIDDLVRPIEADPGLAAQVLKFFNSSYFGFQSTISNVRQGAALVGIRVVKNFVLWKAVFSLIPQTTAPNFKVTHLWQDSLRRAMFARFLAAELKMGDGDLAFAGTLLSDMAIPLLLKRMPAEYGNVLTSAAAKRNRRLSDLELEAFGWTHATAAVVLGRIWKLPDPLIMIVGEHLHLAILEEGPVRSQIERQVSALAALLPMSIYDDWAERETFLEVCEMFLAETSARPASLFAKVDNEYEQYAAILGLQKPKKLLSEFLEQ